MSHIDDVLVEIAENLHASIDAVQDQVKALKEDVAAGQVRPETVDALSDAVARLHGVVNEDVHEPPEHFGEVPGGETPESTGQSENEPELFEPESQPLDEAEDVQAEVVDPEPLEPLEPTEAKDEDEPPRFSGF